MAQVAFYTKSGLGFKSDFAVDDIEIGPCAALGSGKKNISSYLSAKKKR